MNAQVSSFDSLPTALFPRSIPHPARRRLVDDFVLDPGAVERFNRLLARFEHAPLGTDQIATAARELPSPRAGGRAPACIEQQLKRATSIGLMIDDPAWQPANDAVAPAGLVMDYVRSRRDLIPDDLPRVGRLDDAIVIDAAWPRLAGEVACYLDYCRIRRIEAELRGCEVSQFAFGRADWEQARRAESAWTEHCRARGRRSYLPPPPPRHFRVC